MQVVKITVAAGRTFNHPYEQYSNLRPSITLEATLDDADDPTTATKALQAQAEELVEEHKRNLLASIEQIAQMARREQEIARLSRMIAEQQRNLDSLRGTLESEAKQIPMATLLDQDNMETIRPSAFDDDSRPF